MAGRRTADGRRAQGPRIQVVGALAGLLPHSIPRIAALLKLGNEVILLGQVVF
jgi:hypothetical protein